MDRRRNCADSWAKPTIAATGSPAAAERQQLEEIYHDIEQRIEFAQMEG